jgi:hypothetical protein
MRFDRCPWRKNPTTPATPRRVAAVKRRLARNRDAVALLPDLAATVPSCEQELDTLQQQAELRVKRWRAWWAEGWRRARRELALLPALSRSGVLAYWAIATGPKTPEYLQTFIREAACGCSFWTKLRELRQLELIGLRQFPSDRIAAIFQRGGGETLLRAREPSYYAERHARAHALSVTTS